MKALHCTVFITILLSKTHSAHHTPWWNGAAQVLWPANTNTLTMFKFFPKPWKLSVRVDTADEICGSLTRWSSLWREFKINLAFCTSVLISAAVVGTFPWLNLQSDVCHLQAQSRWVLREKHEEEQKLTFENDALKTVLYHLLVSHQTHEQTVRNKRNFLWRTISFV